MRRKLKIMMIKYLVALVLMAFINGCTGQKVTTLDGIYRNQKDSSTYDIHIIQIEDSLFYFDLYDLKDETNGVMGVTKLLKDSFALLNICSLDCYYKMELKQNGNLFIDNNSIHFFDEFNSFGGVFSKISVFKFL